MTEQNQSSQSSAAMSQHEMVPLNATSDMFTGMSSVVPVNSEVKVRVPGRGNVEWLHVVHVGSHHGSVEAAMLEYATRSYVTRLMCNWVTHVHRLRCLSISVQYTALECLSKAHWT